MEIFKCVNCEGKLNGFIPMDCVCGNSIPNINGVYQFTDDKPISIDGDGLKWLGYEHIGENYRPNYVYNKENEELGNYNNFAEFLGNGKVVLDVGAGLGECAISLALSGLRVIAVDISQAMLETAAKRAQKHNVPHGNIIFARMNGYKLSLQSKSIDALLAMDVLHQVDQPELMMDEILRVLKPDGYFLGYGVKNLGFTKEQETANIKYNEIHEDIENFYRRTLAEAGYGEPPYSSWDNADACIKNNFEQFMSIDDTGAFWNNNTTWTLKMGLHKTKTRASGSKQLIPDDVHYDIWAKTEAYAINKYGKNYEDISRYYNHTSGMILFKHRT